MSDHEVFVGLLYLSLVKTFVVESAFFQAYSSSHYHDDPA